MVLEATFPGRCMQATGITITMHGNLMAKHFLTDTVSELIGLYKFVENNSTQFCVTECNIFFCILTWTINVQNPIIFVRKFFVIGFPHRVVWTQIAYPPRWLPKP